MPRSETIQPAQEIKVVASKGNIAYEWIDLIREASELPILPEERQSLRLCKASINNSLLESVDAAVLTTGNRYALAISFEFKDTDQEIPPKNDGTPLSVFGIFARTGMPPQPLLITSSELRTALEQRLNTEEFRMSIDEEDENRIIIDKKNDPELGDNFSIELSSDFRGTTCTLAIESDFDQTVQAFEQKYQTFGVLAEQVAGAIYQAKGETPPSKTITLEPPKDTEVQMKKYRNLIEMRKKQLSAAGFDNDADMDREIDERIVFEGRPLETFDDIGGQGKAKDELQTLAYSLKDPEIFKRWGTYPPRRILLYGPPGTGKTLLARALANSAEAGIFVVEIADIVHSLYGRSERFIQRVFDRAREQAPVILFFDELDALATHRQSSDSVTSRIVNVFLTNLDGMREREDNVMVVGSTNRLEAIDTALLRAGRFDVLVEVPLPNAADREEILKIHMERAIERAGGNTQLFSPFVDLKKIVDITDHFSGADIMEVIRRALNKKVRSELEGQAANPLTTEELTTEINNYEAVRIAKENRKMGFDTRH